MGEPHARTAERFQSRVGFTLFGKTTVKSRFVLFVYSGKRYRFSCYILMRQHGELGIVLRRQAFVAEVAVDLVDPLQPAHQQPLQV